MSVLRSFCPLCKSELDLSTINLSLNQIKCPTCEWSVSGKIENVECPNCKTKNKIILPENYQVFETILASAPCPKRCNEAEKNLKKEKLGELYYLKCDERTEAKIYHPSSLILKCKKCECILNVGVVEGINSAEILKFSPIIRLYSWFGEWLAKGIVISLKKGSCHSVFLNYYRLKRLGEILFCLLSLPLLLSFRYFFFYIADYFNIVKYQDVFRPYYDTYFAILFAISVYICIQIIHQMAIILGELEIVAGGPFRNYSTEPFLFLKGIWLLIIFVLIEVICWYDQIGLFLSQGMTNEVKIMVVDEIAFLPFAFLAAFIVQVIFMLGVFVFTLWYDSKHGISSFKGEFFKVSSSINKLCGLCFYVILYLIAIYTTNNIAVSLSAHYEPLMEMYWEIGHEKEQLLGKFWDYLTIGCSVVIPAVVYFSLLGNLARNLESEELKKIEYKNIEAKGEEKNYLILYMSEVRRSLRTVSIIDYIARLILITYLGIFIKSYINI